MLSIKEIKQITHAQIVNGEENTKIKRFNISSKNHKKDDFYIPIYWREDRHQYILDAVISGAIGYIISKKYNQRDEVIKKAWK